MEQNEGRVLADVLAKQNEESLKEFSNFMEETVQLPSGGIAYKSGTSFVKVRPMRGLEEDILTNQKLVRSGKAFDMLLSNCITDWNGLDLKDLLYGDMNTVFAAIRTISLGADYDVSIICEECGEKQNQTINMIKDFKNKIIEVEPKVSNKNVFEWVSKDGFVFIFKFLTNGDHRFLQEEERMRKAQNKTNYETSMTDTLCQMILSIKNSNGVEVTDRLNIKKLVKERLSIELIKEFADYVNKNKPDYDMSYNFECSSCGAVFNANVPITTEFFWPSTRS